MLNKIPIILGPTASGKTGVGIAVAKKLNGEIISADSRAIFKGMDIGTAKPDLAEQDGVPHHGIDLVAPDERFTVADWVEYTRNKIEEIKNREKLPIIVGGTGLYIDALVFNYQFNESAKNSQSDRQEIDQKYKLYGIKWETEQLRKRIELRTNKIFNEALFEETRQLAKKYDFGLPSMKSNIYPIVNQFLTNQIALDEAKKLNNLADYHLAKRQITWFKRNSAIEWLPLGQIEQKILQDFGFTD